MPDGGTQIAQRPTLFRHVRRPRKRQLVTAIWAWYCARGDGNDAALRDAEFALKELAYPPRRWRR